MRARPIGSRAAPQKIDGLSLISSLLERVVGMQMQPFGDFLQTGVLYGYRAVNHVI